MGPGSASRSARRTRTGRRLAVATTRSPKDQLARITADRLGRRHHHQRRRTANGRPDHRATGDLTKTVEAKLGEISAGWSLRVADGPGSVRREWAMPVPA